MLRRINWKAVLFVLVWCAGLAGLITLMSFIGVKKSGQKCTDVKIIIPGLNSFIDRNEINRIVLDHSGKLTGKFLKDINIHELEKALQENPYIRNAKVYADMDGTVHIEAEQREPLLRVMNLAGQDFYLDREGFKIPSSMRYTPHVLVASGHIPEAFTGKVDSLRTKIGRDLYKMALYIESDTLWREQTEQLYVGQQRDIELIPRVGNHRIILGDADSLEMRLNNLLVFYKKAIPAVGWDAYKVINIKYSNQIVCEKNMSDNNKWISRQTDSTLAGAAKNIQDTNKTTTP